ncbi:ABC transporter ATP-binding protein, partial [Streptococcus pyogenes]
ILLDGNDINDDLSLTRKKINVINGGERNLYWRLTAIENLVYFASLYNISRDEALRISEPLLIEFGLWESRDIPVEQYSKGMKQ